MRRWRWTIPGKPGGMAEYTGHLLPKGMYPVGGEAGSSGTISEPIREGDYEVVVWDRECECPTPLSAIAPANVRKLGEQFIAWAGAMEAAAAGRAKLVMELGTVRELEASLRPGFAVEYCETGRGLCRWFVDSHGRQMVRVIVAGLENRRPVDVALDLEGKLVPHDGRGGDPP